MSNFDLLGSCPSGNDCPVHFRIDRVVSREEDEIFSAVEYVGEFCIISGDNPKYTDPYGGLEALAYSLSHGHPPMDFFETAVYRVGEGSLYDITDGDLRTKPEKVYHTGSYQGVQDAHTAAVLEFTSE